MHSLEIWKLVDKEDSNSYRRTHIRSSLFGIDIFSSCTYIKLKYSRSNILKENACSPFCTPSSKLASVTQLHKQFFWPGLKTPSLYPIVIFVEHSHLAGAVLLLQGLGPRPSTNFAFAIDLLPPGLENKKQWIMPQNQTFHGEIIRIGWTDSFSL